MFEPTTDNAPQILPPTFGIYLVQLIGAAAVILATFGIHLTPELQGAIVAGIVALLALVTMLLHFINHKVANATAAAAVNTVKRAYGPVTGMGSASPIVSLTPPAK